MDIVKEILERHDDREIIAHLDKILGGIIKNYKIALTTGRNEAIWGSFGDIMQVYEIVHEMRRRDSAREAQKNEM